MKECLDKSLDYLDLDKKIIERLKENNILKVKDIWALKRADLKRLSFKDSEIYHISIKLQLVGLDLNKKYN